MPGTARAAEDQASVPNRVARNFRVEFVEAWMVAPTEATLGVEDDRASSPGLLPFLLRIEAEDVRAEFSVCITVRRDRAAPRRVVPIETKAKAFGREDSRDEASIAFALQFGDEVSS